MFKVHLEKMHFAGKQQNQAQTGRIYCNPTDHNADRAFLQEVGTVGPLGSERSPRMAPVMCINELCARVLEKGA